MKKLIGILIFLLFGLHALAQDQAFVDSLQTYVDTVSSDEKRVDALNELAYQYAGEDSLQAETYWKKALTLAQQVGYHTGAGVAYNNKGWILLSKSRYQEAASFFLKGLEKANQGDEPRPRGSAYEGLGIISRRQGNYPKALEYYFKALKIREETNDQSGISTSYNNIGIIYFYQENYEKAAEFYQKALEINRKINYKPWVATNLINIGEVTYFLGRYQEAIEVYSESLSLYQELESENGLAYCYHGLGETCLAIGQLDSAQSFLEEALRLRRKLIEPENIAITLVVLGKVQYQKKQYPRAVASFSEAIAEAERINYPEAIKNASIELSKTYKALGNYQKAYENLSLFQQMSDSLDNEDKVRQLTRLEANFEFEKEKDSLRFEQEKERLFFEEERKRKAATQRATFIGLGLVSLLVVVVLYFLLDKQKTNRKLEASNTDLAHSNAELKTAHEEIQAINDYLQTTLSTVRQQNQKICDSINYAQRIQQTILPTPSQLEKAFSDHFIFFQPRDVVSGDFYWMGASAAFPEKTVFAVVDCTGHGVPGAFMSMVANDLLNNIVNEKHIVHPEIILEELHKEVRRSLRQEEGSNRDGMDIALITWDKASQILSFAGAKNPLLLFPEGEEMLQIKGDKMPIGGHQREQERKFSTHPIELKKTTQIYLFTDGFRDQFGGESGRKFMASRFRELIASVQHLPMEKQHEELRTTFAAWKRTNQQIDDVLVAGIRLEIP